MRAIQKKALVAAVLLAVACTSASAGAERDVGKKMNITAKSASKKGENLDARLAIQLAQYGDKNKDALALIMAAKLQIENGISVKDQSKKSTKIENGTKTTAAAKAPVDPSTQALLVRARQYAGDRKDMIALADDVQASGSRGRVSGPGVHQDVVMDTSFDTYNVRLNGDELAKIAISGDGDTDLDLFVYDQNDNEVCSSTSSGDDEYCEFTPSWTGDFTVKVKNYGNVYNRYTLLMN